MQQCRRREGLKEAVHCTSTYWFRHCVKSAAFFAMIAPELAFLCSSAWCVVGVLLATAAAAAVVMRYDVQCGDEHMGGIYPQQESNREGRQQPTVHSPMVSRIRISRKLLCTITQALVPKISVSLAYEKTHWHR